MKVMSPILKHRQIVILLLVHREYEIDVVTNQTLLIFFSCHVKLYFLVVKNSGIAF